MDYIFMKRLYTLILCVITIQPALATKYFVTNNHVLGTGSFGQAIISANTNIGKDTIYFSIPSVTVAGRTITVSNDSLLPNIKDTVLIDATTQSGEYFGISSAKIQITSADTADVGLVIDVAAPHSELYGFFINHFSTGIRLLANGFIMGAANNGNVVSHCEFMCIKISGVTEGTLAAAFVGVDTSAAIGTSPNAIGILVDSSKKVAIGGKGQNNKNIISGCNVGLKIADSKFIIVQGNYIGTNLYAQFAVPNYTGILVTESNDGDTKNIQIGGDSSKYLNVISGNLQRGLDLDFSFSFVQGNKIGTNITGTSPLGNGSYGIYFRGDTVSPSHDNSVGGINPGEANLIAYNGGEGVYLENPAVYNILIRGNSLYCNSQISGAGGIKLNGGNQEIAPPTLVIVSPGFVSGIASPFSEVDIYAADSCNTCEGAEYLGTATADSNGIFTDTLPINKKVTATSTDSSGNTSEFAACADSSNTSCVYSYFLKSKSKACTGEPVAFTDLSISVPGSAITGWNWVFSDGQSSNLQNPEISFPLGGNWYITLVITNASGCSDTVVDSILVKEAVSANFTADQAVCFGAPIHFTDLSFAEGSSFIVSWFWDLGDGNNSIFTDFLYDYDLPGSYIVSLSVVNNNNCTDVHTDTISVHGVPLAQFDVSPDTCVNAPIVFTDSSNAAAGSFLTLWSWDFGDGGASTNQNTSHLFTTPGNYPVTLIVTDNFGCSDTAVQNLGILDVPVADFLWTLDGLSVSFINISTYNPENSMQWTMGDGSISSLITPTHTYSAPGAYEVCLIVNDFTCNMSDTLCQTVLITDIDDVSGNSEFIVSPNPASHDVSVSNLPNSASIKTGLFNSLGKEIQMQQPLQTNSDKFTLSLPALPEGIYWLRFESEESIIIKKLIISQK